MFSTARAILASRNLFLARTPSASPLLTPIFTKRTMTSAVAKRLEGKTIVVTGASSGIGRSCAFEFARTQPDNLRLILTARRIDTLRDVAAKIHDLVGAGVQILPLQLDVSNPDEVRSFVSRLPEEWRDINILVNNAYAPPPHHFLDYPR
jgi:3-hydroxy acid dehydrogenase / malonic semialdehyde reductase